MARAHAARPDAAAEGRCAAAGRDRPAASERETRDGELEAVASSAGAGALGTAAAARRKPTVADADRGLRHADRHRHRAHVDRAVDQPRPTEGLRTEAKRVGTLPAASGSAAPVEAAPPCRSALGRKLPGPWRIADSKGDPNLRTWSKAKSRTDPFIKALSAAGVPEKEAYRVLTAMKGVRDFDKCNKSDRFTALLERGSSRLKAFEYAVGPEEIYQAREGDDGLLKGSKLDLKVERNQVTGALIYDGKSFDASAERAGFDAGLGARRRAGASGASVDGRAGAWRSPTRDRPRGHGAG